VTGVRLGSGSGLSESLSVGPSQVGLSGTEEKGNSRGGGEEALRGGFETGIDAGPAAPSAAGVASGDKREPLPGDTDDCF
jgi:hypothetical protein